MNCESAREQIHAALDDDAPLDVDTLAHVGTCGGCGALYEELSALRDSLRALPREPLPPAALDAVWSQTVRATPRARFSSGWRAAAAALIVTLAGWATIHTLRETTAPSGPSAAELARAQAQADLVFGYTGRALAATRHAATRQVIQDRVAPAVRGKDSTRTVRSSS